MGTGLLSRDGKTSSGLWNKGNEPMRGASWDDSAIPSGQETSKDLLRKVK